MKLRWFHWPMSRARTFRWAIRPAAGGEVVGGPLGEIAQRRGGVQPHEAGDDLVQGPVSAGGNDQVIRLPLSGHSLGGILRGGGLMDPDEIAGAGEDGQRVEQRAVGLVAPGPGIENEQQLFFLQMGHLPVDSFIKQNAK